ncbi:MAG: site-2 protease family protein [Bacteroidetes bacterium]|jgi:membrane-associated protease RseP (regulator of RpoE activity)|nr:site-2 protease family protein [Bacteroidota bacterium]
MNEPFEPPVDSSWRREIAAPRRLWLHAFLFVITFLTTTVSGIIWIYPEVAFDLEYLSVGFPYAFSVMFILTAHEFGHYFAARAHGVDTSLPYYIPFPTIPPLSYLFLNFGTFGAIIRTRSIVPSRKAIFDIGVAGPIAGFIASIGVLVYGYVNLPPADYLLSIHPDYDFTTNSIRNSEGMGLAFGDTLLLAILRGILTQPGDFVPPMSEIYHYPFLCAGWFGLFVTALNLIPLGQFDGGHVIYAMFGERHKPIARATFYALLGLSAPAMSDAILRLLLTWATGEEQPQIVPFAEHSWSAWFVWAIIALVIVKLYHPPVPDESPLDERRKWVGWATFGIFVLTFSPNPIIVSLP